MASVPLSVTEILSGFTSAVPKVKKTKPYTFGIIVTAVCLLLMPVVYVGIILVIGGLSVWHLITNYGIMSWHIGSWVGLLIKAFCYLGPVIGAGTMIVFMVKPFFRKTPQPVDSILLLREDAPGFYEFVDAVCRCVGALPPSEIRITNQVNASASFVNGSKGIFDGKLCLTVGLPLLSGMNTRALAGVIAHEFGHFTQGAGMRITFLIRTVIWSFHRIVYERDSLDEQIEHASKQADYRILPFIYLSRLMIWLSRFILEKVSYLGMLVGMFTMRQMEFDADRYEIRLVGSDQFPKTARNLRSLGFAWQEADQIAAQCYHDDKTLPDNFGVLMRFALQKMTPELVEKMNAEHLKTKPDKMDSHPSDAQRNEAAERENATGIFTIEHDPRILFPDFESIAQKCTKQYFSHVTDADVSTIPLYNALEMARYMAIVELDHASFQRQFGEVAGIFAPLPLSFEPADASGIDYTEVLARIDRERDTILAASQAFDKVTARLVEVRSGLSAIKAGYTIKPGQFEFDDCTEEGALCALDDARKNLEKAREALNRATVPLQQRLQSAFSRLVLKPELYADLQALKALSLFFQEQRENTTAFFETYQQVTFLLNQEEIESPLRENELVNLVKSLDGSLAMIRQASKSLIVPLARKPENRDLERYLFGKGISSPRMRTKFIEEAGTIIGLAGRLYNQVHGRLARLMETEETLVSGKAPFYAFPEKKTE